MTKKEQFEKYLFNSAKINRIQKEIDQVLVYQHVVDDKIDAAEKAGANMSEIDSLCCEYNELEEKRIELSLRKNKIEKEMLLFELDMIKSE